MKWKIKFRKKFTTTRELSQPGIVAGKGIGNIKQTFFKDYDGNPLQDPHLVFNVMNFIEKILKKQKGEYINKQYKANIKKLNK